MNTLVIVSHTPHNRQSSGPWQEKLKAFRMSLSETLKRYTETM